MKKLIPILALTAGLSVVAPSLATANVDHARSGRAHCATKHQRSLSRCHRKTRGAVARRASVASAPTPGPTQSLAVSCNLYASPTGSDTSGNGGASAPFATLTKLDQALSPGQTGCLNSGTYGGLTVWSGLTNSGTNTGEITITSAPGQTATIDGYVDIQASYTTLENVRVDGSNTMYGAHPAGVTCPVNVSQPLSITGTNDTLQYVNYFQSVPATRGNAIGVGFLGTDPADTVIRYNKIHDVGGCDFYDHLIYLAGGSGAQIYDNWMWNDAHGWGIKLDPGPTNSRIWGNVIDRAGSGFNLGNSSGTNPTADNQIFDNIVMNSVGVSNPDIHWSHPGVMILSPGLLPNSTGNMVYDNDSYNNPGGTSDLHDISTSQISVTGTSSKMPRFVDGSAHNFTLQTSSLTEMHGMIRG